MGESAVLFHSYSFAAPLSRHESHEDNTIHALSQSVSFGRFTTESLEWGKWSSFSHKKYVDEAEKYSQPGSVAQKKAFFDAVIEVLYGLEEKENHAEDGSSSVEKERKSVTKNSSLFRSEAPDKAMELGVTRKTSENLMKNNEKPVRQRFMYKLLFFCDVGFSWETLRLNVRTPRESQIRNQTNHFYVFASTLMWSGKQKGQPKLRRGISENKR
ncbi:unnamed protein product [Brassica oleracea]